MSLSDFRISFQTNLNLWGVDVPDNIKNASDAEFTIVVNNHLRPFKDDLNLAYSNLETLIVAAGYKVPELNEEQKAKVKRYIQAFIECTA
jgi:hypothetical protein